MAISIFGGRTILPDELTAASGGLTLTSDHLRQLRRQGITDWDQLYALTTNPRTKKGLALLLDMGQTDIDRLAARSEEMMPAVNKAKMDSLPGFRFPLGARKTETRLTKAHLQEEGTISNLRALTKLSSLETFLEAPGLQLAGSVNYVSQLPPTRSQGDRGSCTAFAVTAANEFFFFRKTGRQVDLSEQYLFNETKLAEGNSGCGSFIFSTLQIVANKGECPESTWSYNPNLPCVQSAGEPANADDMALPFRNGFIPYNDTNDLVLQIKGSLTIGHLTVFSIPVYDSWYNNKDTILTGRIIMPNPGELPLKDEDNNDAGHSMAIVGYQDDVTVDGGGFFILRNSWGPQVWGASNHYGPGYGTIPYTYISDLHWEVYAM